MATKKKAETADLKPIVENPYPKWKPSENRLYICPNCGHETTGAVLKFLKKCPVCGESAE